MSNIYPFGQTYQYLLTHSQRNQRAGKYDQAMMLLTKARRENSQSAETEAAIASIYDEIGCEEDAIRSYLRVVRLGGENRSDALFKLSLTFFQRGDILRALAYFEAFASSGRSGVADDMAQLLERQLAAAVCSSSFSSRRRRAAHLEKRAVQSLHAGRMHAAKRNAERAIRLEETAQRHLLKACCHLTLEECNAAAVEASEALRLKPVYVQALCLLVDAYAMLGRCADAKHAALRALKQARTQDSLFSVAVECAKHGYDRMALIATKRMLRREPFHVRAMEISACAHMNLRHYARAERLFAMMRTLVPDNVVYDSYYKLAQTASPVSERLIMTQDLTHAEAVNRAYELLSVLHEEPSQLRADPEQLERISKIAQWALYSPQAGENVTLVAIIILSALDTEQTQNVLLDAVMSPKLDDEVKLSILQAMKDHCSQRPEYADLGGRMVRIASGAAISGRAGNETAQEVVQLAADTLLKRYPDAADELLNLWLRCLNRYGLAKGRHAAACSAALELSFHLRHGRGVPLRALSRRYGVSRRLINLWASRMMRLQDENTFDESWRKDNEMHQL